MDDPLTVVLRSGARRLLARAIEIEVSGFLAAHADLKDDPGRQRIVRHGHHRERQVQTGIELVAVRCPGVRDRRPGGRGRQDPFHPGDLAALPRTGEIRRRALALALPEGHLDRRRLRDPDRASGAERPRPPGARAPGKARSRRPGATSASGPTGSVSSPVWIMTSNASRSSSALMNRAARSCRRSPTATARAPGRGAGRCPIPSGAASGWRPGRPSATWHPASGKPCARPTPPRANSAAGRTKPATSRTSYPGPCGPRPGAPSEHPDGRDRGSGRSGVGVLPGGPRRQV